jgi:hypothetical protein
MAKNRWYYGNMDTASPTKITAGNSVSWLLSLPDYPASAGWTVTYYLLNAAGAIDFSSAAESDSHLFAIAASTTAEWTAGKYKYTTLVSDGTDRYTVETGNIEILPDPSELTTHDGRTHAEIVLENIESVLEGKATADNLKYEINGRSLEKYPWGDLIKMRSHYRAEVATEKTAAAGKKTNKVLVRFI